MVPLLIDIEKGHVERKYKIMNWDQILSGPDPKGNTEASDVSFNWNQKPHQANNRGVERLKLPVPNVTTQTHAVNMMPSPLMLATLPPAFGIRRQSAPYQHHGDHINLHKFPRTTWKPDEDIALLHILLRYQDQLKNPLYSSSPRSKFW